MDVEILLWCNR